jgi:hypothetical protein
MDNWLTPPWSAPAGRDAAGQVEEHVGGIQRLAVERSSGLPGLMPAPLATVPAVEDFTGELRPASVLAQRRGTSKASSGLRRERLAGLDAGAARHHWPVVRRIGIDEGACGWQVYPQ